MYEFVRGLWGVLVVIVAHRRSGKSSTGIIICLEEALRTAGASVALVCKTKDQAKGIVNDILPEIWGDCPKALQPRYVKSEYTYHFANGSQLVLLPADGLHKTKVRGRKFRFILITEGAFIPGIRKLIASVLAPTTRDVTGKTAGTILLESTPPDPNEVDEDDMAEFVGIWEQASIEGRAFCLPLSDNPDASQEFRDSAASDCGGEHTEAYQREYECKFGGVSDRSAVPEFTLAKALELVREVPRVPGTDRYVGMDPGGTHPTAILWAWYWFAEDLLVIEDEAMLDNPSSAGIEECVRARESALWPAAEGKLFRFSDNDNIVLLNDLYDAGVRFDATEKDAKQAHLNGLRLLVKGNRIAIHPRCRKLVATLRAARRSKATRKGFQEIDGLGHADLLDALLYICRNVRRNVIPDEKITIRQPQDRSNAPVRIPAKVEGPDAVLRRVLARNWLRR